MPLLLGKRGGHPDRPIFFDGAEIQLGWTPPEETPAGEPGQATADDAKK